VKYRFIVVIDNDMTYWNLDLTTFKKLSNLGNIISKYILISYVALYIFTKNLKLC
jgi:hypothetical protein